MKTTPTTCTGNKVLTDKVLSCVSPANGAVQKHCEPLLRRLQSLIYLVNPIIIARGGDYAQLGESLGRALNVKVFQLLIEPLSLPEYGGIIFGAAADHFDVHSLDDEVIDQFGIPKQAALRCLQLQRAALLKKAAMIPPEQLWYFNRNKFEKTTVFYVDPAIVSGQMFKTALECFKSPGIDSIVPVTPYLYKPAVINVYGNGRLQSGVYVNQFQQLEKLEQCLSHN